MVISIACSSETWRRMAGMVGLPASREARQRRSPAMSWKRPLAQRAHQHRLYYSVGGDGGGQFGQLLLIHMGAGLEGVVIDLIEGNLAGLAAFSLDGGGSGS